jgi:AraC-like DNA-binding protein
MLSMISVRKLEVILARAVSLTGAEDLGLALGTNAPDHTYQLLGHLMLSASTPLEAFELYRRFSPLVVDDLRLALTVRDSNAKLSIGYHACAAPQTERFGIEVITTSIVRVMRNFVGHSGFPREVWFRHPRPAYHARYASVFGCPVRFSQPENALLADAAVLHVPQPHSDLTTARLLRSAAEELLKSRGRRANITERLRERLRAEKDLCNVNMAKIASEFGLTHRTLRRRVQAEGACTARILEQAREEFARAELQRPGVCFAEIAERIGYSEPSAFFRAFKRWTGLTPAKYARAAESGTLSEALANARRESSG